MSTIALAVGNADVLYTPGNPTQPMADAFLALDEGIAPALSADGTLEFYATTPLTANYNFYVIAPENTQVAFDIDGVTAISGTIG
ncbi:MAG: hypothetical protein L6Q97_26625, partial [Thermoanaerobaculia bacterium]|nr:hypothetical protein [Thermoanaerobaculia bacterium]